MTLLSEIYPDPEPPKPLAVGDWLARGDDHYVLGQFGGMYAVGLMNVRTGKRWDEPVEVVDGSALSRHEVGAIIRGRFDEWRRIPSPLKD